MKNILTLITLLACQATSIASTPEQEKAFVTSYKKACETSDTKTLEAFLYTEGADADTIRFFKLMQATDVGQTITKIELIAMTKEEIAAFEKPRTMPDGKSYKMPFLPTKRLVMEITTKEANGSSTSKSESSVAEHKGKLVIPVPVPVKS